MPLISRSLINLVNGVSEQPAPLRSPTQAEYTENARQTAFAGTEKRAGTNHLLKLTGSPSVSVNDIFFPIKYSDGSEYLVLVQGGSGTEVVRVFSTAGVEQTVTAPSGYSYLTYSGGDQLKYLQAGDTSLILNPNKTTALSGSTSTAQVYEALVWVKFANPPGAPGCKYTITLDGTTASRDDREYDQSLSWGTSDIADALAGNLFTALGGGAANYTITQLESYIHIKRTNGADFALTVSDTKGNEWIQVIKGKTQLISDLPVKCKDGFICQITGNAGSAKDDYYVKFFCEDTGVTFGRGSWRETIKPGITYQLDNTTMPFSLTKTGASSFTFGPVTWGDRTVGDATTAPTPSFIGNKITDLFFFKNRLGLISKGTNVILSRAGDYYYFFPKSVITYLDDNPIDLTVDIGESTNIYHATVSEDGAILWGDRSQFLLKGGDVLSPKTASAKRLTSFECNKSVRPVTVGRNIYFMTPATRDYDMRVMEYFFYYDSQNRDAADITSHTPKIARAIYPRLISSPKDNQVFTWDAGVVSTVFKNNTTHIWQPALKTYKFHLHGDEKIQSSWSHWYFDESSGGTSGGVGNGGAVVGACCSSSKLYALVYRAISSSTDGYYLESMDLNPDQADNYSSSSDYYIDHYTLLDRKLDASTCSPTYLNGVTTWTLPYKSRARIRVVTKAGVEIRASNTIGTTSIIAVGNYASTACWIGQEYTLLYRPSEQFEKDDKGAIDTTGRIQYQYWKAYYEKTGFFTVEVTPIGRTTKTYTFGSSASVVDNYTTYPTWNPSDKGGNVNLSSGNLRAESSGHHSVRATQAKSTGKWYWEFTLDAKAGAPCIGVMSAGASITDDVYASATGWAYRTDALKLTANGTGSSGSYGINYGVGDVVSVLLDMTTGSLSFWVNGVDQGVAFTGLTGPLYPAFSSILSSSGLANFGASSFAYTPPTGYSAWALAGTFTTTVDTGDTSLPSGSFSIPVLSRSAGTTIDLKSNHWLPCKFTSLEYTANYFTRYNRR